ncbi:GNAT family N-acetyltransferase [Micromonospora sp. NPDC050397]|uniref:GNAT family N-acetyltransferase n=1 Tax=Micromonospora sp. NPDC050397 TaxID=3364279 RepID=UPI00384ED702
MTWELRPVVRRDVSRLVVLLGQLGYPTDEAAVHERLDHWLDDPASWLVGADDNGELVGVAALHVLPMLEVSGKFGRLLALVVDDRYRSRGVGQALVTAVETRAREAGCIRLEVTSSRHRDRAHAFYQRLGYEDASPSKARFLKDLVTIA